MCCGSVYGGDNHGEGTPPEGTDSKENSGSLIRPIDFILQSIKSNHGLVWVCQQSEIPTSEHAIKEIRLSHRDKKKWKIAWEIPSL